MRFKKDAIKPGMAIKCQKEEDARALLKYLGELGFPGVDWALNEPECCKEDAYITADRSKGVGFMPRGEECLRITEFSDLIEAEPRFKVGDKVRVRKDLEVGNHYGGRFFNEEMSLYKGETLEVEGDSAGNYSLSGKHNIWDWNDEMLEPVEIADNSSAEMSTVEVLEWLRQNDEEDPIIEIFGYPSVADVIERFSPVQIISLIAAYEAAKKKPRSVEVEYLLICHIYEWSGEDWVEANTYEHIVDEKCENEYEFAKQDLLDYVQSPKRRRECYVASERRCRVKEDNQ